MTCPRCSGELKAQKREGIEIDTCSNCRGIWLDRGELERLTAAENDYYDDDDDGGGFGDDDDDDGRGGRGGRQKKRGFFQNLMDNLGDIGG